MSELNARKRAHILRVFNSRIACLEAEQQLIKERIKLEKLRRRRYE